MNDNPDGRVHLQHAGVLTMPNGAQNLGTQLGSLLFGKADPSAYLRGQVAGSQVQSALEEARLRRSQAINQEGQNNAVPLLGDAATKLGLTPDQASGYQTLGQAGGGDAVALIKALGLVRGQGYQSDARTAALGGDYNAANANLVGLADKPMDLTKIAGGQQYNPLVTPDSGQSITTPLGLADIGLRHAQAGASGAQANAANAHARLFDTQTAAGGFSAKSGTSTTGDAAEALLSPDAQSLVSASLSHGYTIPLPNFGFGARGSEAKAGALNALAKSFKDQGVSPDDAVSSMINGKTATMGLGDIARSSAKVNAWENSAAQQADIALELSNKVDRTGVPVFNKWLLAGRQGTGDATVSQFNNANNTLAEEYARVMGGGNATATDSTRQLAHTMINSAMTQDQYTGTVALMKREMATRKGALHESTLQQRQGIVAPASSGLGAMGAPSGEPSAKPLPGQVDNGYRFKGGDPANPMNWEKL